MEVPSWPGRDGTHIPASGMAVHIFPSGSVSESASSEVMDGAGVVGDSIGTTTTQFITTTGTTPIAERFITGTPSIAVEASVAEGLTGPEEASAAEGSTGPVQRAGLSTETTRLPEVTRHLTARAASAPAPSAATTMADKPEAFLHAETPASAAVVDFTAAEHLTVGAAIVNQSFVMLQVDFEIQKRRRAICGERN